MLLNKLMYKLLNKLKNKLLYKLMNKLLNKLKIIENADCTTLEKVEWICTVSLRLVE